MSDMLTRYKLQWVKSPNILLHAWSVCFLCVAYTGICLALKSLAFFGLLNHIANVVKI